MALSSAIVWEVQTGGHSDNGGGFKTGASGTDRSQSTSPHVTIDGATITATVHTTTTQLNISGYTVATADVGNIVKITGGTATAGYYEITAVDTGNNRWTLDRSAGSSSQTATGRMGGCSNHPNTIASAVVNGNKIWIKAGTYNRQGSNTYVLQLATTGSSGLGIVWEGYNSTRGDKPSGTNRPLLDMASASTYVLNENNKSWNIFKFLRFTGATSHGIYNGDGHCAYFACAIYSNGGKGIYNSGWGYTARAFACEIYSNSSDGFLVDGPSGCSFTAVGCYVHDNSGVGIGQNYAGLNTPLIAIENICDSNSSHGIYFRSNGALCYGNILYNNTGASTDGVNCAFGDSFHAVNLFLNNASISNGRYGFSNSSSLFPFNFNSYNGNGTSGISGFTAGEWDLTSDPKFVDPASGYFGLQWGSPLINTGLWGVMQNYNGYLGTIKQNIGIDQNQNFFTWGRGTITKDTTDARSGSCIKFDPASQTKELAYRFYVPCTNATAFTVKFYVKKSSSSANCTLTFSASGSGVSAINDASVTLTDTYAQYTSSSMTPNQDGFVECILKAKDGSTTGDIFVDDISIA